MAAPLTTALLDLSFRLPTRPAPGAASPALPPRGEPRGALALDLAGLARSLRSPSEDPHLSSLAGGRMTKPTRKSPSTGRKKGNRLALTKSTLNDLTPKEDAASGPRGGATAHGATRCS
jgi:hypothetical protein